MTDLQQQPTRLIHSLAEVCVETSLSTEEILLFAGQGKISIFAKVLPEIGKVECVNACTLDIPEGKSEQGYPNVYETNHVNPIRFSGLIEDKVRHNVDGIFVSTKDCLEILSQGSISQIVFKSGVVIQGLSSPFIATPISSKLSDNIGKTEGLTDWYFAIYPNIPTYKTIHDFFGYPTSEVKQPCYLEINATNLFVTSDELVKFKKALLCPPTRPVPNDEFIHHENKAQLLVALDQAAYEMFGNSHPYALRKYSTIKAIVTNLIDNYEFSANVAPAAAKIIKPAATNRVVETINGVHYRTEGLVKLINAWGYFYKSVNLKDTGTFDSKEDVAAKLAEEFDVSFDATDTKSLPMKLSTIIRPVNAKAGTRNPKIKID